MSWSEALSGLDEPESCLALLRDGGVAAGVGDRSSPRGCRPLFVVLKAVSTIHASKSRWRRRARRTGVGPGSTCTVSTERSSEHWHHCLGAVPFRYRWRSLLDCGAVSWRAEPGSWWGWGTQVSRCCSAVIAVAAPGVVSQPVLASDCHPRRPTGRQLAPRAHLWTHAP